MRDEISNGKNLDRRSTERLARARLQQLPLGSARAEKSLLRRLTQQLKFEAAVGQGSLLLGLV